MKTVLHLSDLHLKNDDYPKEKLDSLIQIIKNKKILIKDQEKNFFRMF